MKRRSWPVFLAACLFVIPITFALGHWSRSGKRPSETTRESPVSHAGTSREGQRAVDAKDLEKVAIENLGQVEFDHAYELIHSAPKEVLSVWSRRLEALPVAPRKTAAIDTFFKTLAQIDTRTAVDLALSLERADSRWAAIWAVNAATPAANLSEVARMFTELDERKLPIVGDLIANWSQTDPEATARFLSSYPGEVTNDDIAAFLWNWAARDPAAATAWLTQADARRHDPAVYVGLYAGWMRGDRAGALTDLAVRAADKAFEKAVRKVTEILFTDSADSARAFILTLPNSAAQEAAVDQFTGLDMEPEDLTKWLFTLPENLWHKQIGSVIDQWADADRSAVNVWIEQLAPPVRDRILAESCLAFDWENPAPNFQAGLRISDATQRRETFRQLFAKMEPEVREELVAKAELAPAELTELRKSLMRP